MRPKVAIVLLLAGLLGLGGILFLKHLGVPTQPAAISSVQPANTVIAPPEIKTKPAQLSQTTPTVNDTATNPVATVPPATVNTNKPAAAPKADIQSQLDRLQDLQANDDAASLQAILAELTNSDKTIRAAAVESTIQFGSRDAIPVLKDLAARTEDPAEKKQLLDAADFLALPTLTELRAQKQ